MGACFMKSLIYGNGESRQVWDVTKSMRVLQHGVVMQFTEMPL